jgi:hypothetical protein
VGRICAVLREYARYYNTFPRSTIGASFAAAGGLITYGTYLADAYRQIGVYAGRILKGEKPAELVVQPTKFELVLAPLAACASGSANASSTISPPRRTRSRRAISVG